MAAPKISGCTQHTHAPMQCQALLTSKTWMPWWPLTMLARCPAEAAVYRAEELTSMMALSGVMS